MRKTFAVMATVALVASTGGYYAARVLNPADVPVRPGEERVSVPQVDDLLGQRRPDFILSDTEGNPVSADDFDGRVWLVNFWATWCAPCVEEMPMLSELQAQYTGKGVKIVGIALDDAGRAAEFAASLGINYPVLVGQTDVVMTGRRFGNATGMLPFSVLMDTSGIVRWTHLGALSRDVLETEIRSLTGHE